MTNDQEYYQNLIDEMNRFIHRLHQWREQCDSLTPEGDCLNIAISNAIKCVKSLVLARDAHFNNQEKQKEALLERIRTGTTTYTDATLAKGFMQ